MYPTGSRIDRGRFKRNGEATPGMEFVVGRPDGTEGPAGRLGQFLALDGSTGAPVGLDFARPHAALVVGKRGYGKSFTLGVIAEELARSPPIAPVVVDPMGEYAGLAAGAGASVPAEVIANPTVAPTAVDPRSWPALVGLAPESGAGGLVWRAAREGETIEAMGRVLKASAAPAADERAAINHLELAASWGAFDPDGLDAAALASGAATVLDLSGLGRAPMNAVLRGVGETLYRARTEGTIERLPWLLVDEAHAFFDGVAGETLGRLFTRGRTPGVSLVAATQRPDAVPAVGISQADVLIAHRLTAERDLTALEAAQPTYAVDALADRLPGEPGEAVLVDDASETVQTVRIRDRETPHGGESPRASE